MVRLLLGAGHVALMQNCEEKNRERSEVDRQPTTDGAARQDGGRQATNLRLARRNGGRQATDHQGLGAENRGATGNRPQGVRRGKSEVGKQTSGYTLEHCFARCSCIQTDMLRPCGTYGLAT